MFLFFLGIFFTGLALNLTPCVYPMMAVTLSVFSGQKKLSSSKTFLRASLYVLGIATTYSVLGTASALTGGLFGGVMRSRIVLAVISFIFFGLSLSMFGLYEIRLPAKLTGKLGALSPQGGAGIYISGIFVGVFAAPCAGPPVIALLALTASRADPFFGFFVFFILSLGLGFPYLILGMFTGLIKRLPKSGDWMVWFKKFLGVILIAVGFFYFSLSFKPALAFVLIPLTLFAGGIYLGFIEKHGQNIWFKRVKYVLGIILILISIVFYQNFKIKSFSWREYGAFDIWAVAAKGGGVIYFSADWCVPCLELDRRTFISPDVIAELSELKTYKVDLTNYESASSLAAREKFNIAGVPTIIFIDAKGGEIKEKRIVGFISKDDFLKEIKEVKKIFGSGKTTAAANGKKEEEKPSRALIAADIEEIIPGSYFNLGVLFIMEDEWYVYWKNPADAGREPVIKWSYPEGFVFDELKWPYPKRFSHPPFSSFGIDGELLLFHKVYAPQTLLPGDTVLIKADVSWLVCRDICISQEEKLTLTLKVSDGPPRPSNFSGKFEKTKNNFPVYAEGWEFKAGKNEDYINLFLSPPDGVTLDILNRSDFFPEEPGIVRTEKPVWRKKAGEYVLQMRRDSLRKPLKRFKGVLVLPEGAGLEKRALTVDCVF